MAAWAVLGFSGFRDYPDLLSRLTDAVQAKSYSATALGLAAGVPDQVASLSALAAGAVVLGLTFVVARRRERRWPTSERSRWRSRLPSC